jgi:hypothetical protein
MQSVLRLIHLHFVNSLAASSQSSRLQVICKPREFKKEEGYISSIFTLHYGRMDISRVSIASPSAKNRALGEDTLRRVLHSGKKNTQGREASPSAIGSMALGEERHSVTPENSITIKYC